MFEAAQADEGNQEVIGLVRQDTDWEHLKKLPLGSTARMFLGANKTCWSMLRAVTNRARQSLLQLGGTQIVVPKECREQVLENIDTMEFHGLSI